MKPRHTITPTLIAFIVLIAPIASWLLPSSSAQGQVQVTLATPSAAQQGTIGLNVKVNGKGFKNGAKAKWFVTGTTDTGGVTVNSTAFVSSTELTANITVADTAALANFDIQVTNSDGRGGKGTELFAVTPKGNGNALCPPILPAPTVDTKCYAALPGCLDSAFSGVGFVRFSATGTENNPDAMAVQADGKIVVALGSYSPATSTDILVIRYNVDGSFDTSFGDTDPFNGSVHLGYTTTSLSTGADLPRSLILQPDGKIIVTGHTAEPREVVLRYNTNGTLDLTFGNAGVVTLNSYTYDVVLQSDGKIVIGGNTSGSNPNFSVWRLNPNGAPDTSFGSGGQVIANGSGSTKKAVNLGASVAIQRVPATTGEERIVLTGSSWANSPPVWTTMRFRSNGAADTTFGTSGIVRTDFLGFGDRAQMVRIDSSNRIVVTGFSNSYSGTCGLYTRDASVVRYTQDGVLDGSFGGGKQTIDVYGGRDEAVGLAVQPDGKIVIFVGAQGADAVVNHAAVIRFNPDGTRDSTFGLSGNGIVTFDASGSNNTDVFPDWGAFAVSPVDGKIVVAGTSWYSTAGHDETFVARYLP